MYWSPSIRPSHFSMSSMNLLDAGEYNCTFTFSSVNFFHIRVRVYVYFLFLIARWWISEIHTNSISVFSFFEIYFASLFVEDAF